jgi:hypothetical protein
MFNLVDETAADPRFEVRLRVDGRPTRAGAMRYDLSMGDPYATVELGAPVAEGLRGGNRPTLLRRPPNAPIYPASRR